MRHLSGLCSLRDCKFITLLLQVALIIFVIVCSVQFRALTINKYHADESLQGHPPQKNKSKLVGVPYLESIVVIMTSFAKALEIICLYEHNIFISSPHFSCKYNNTDPVLIVWC